MALETGLVFDRQGNELYWHFPIGRTGGFLPDSRSLWDVLWDNREILGGVAHTHPWHGEPSPSAIDVTTFAAVEAGLGKRLVWPIVTFDKVIYFEWTGPERLDYEEMAIRRFRISKDSIARLVDMSQ